jgi:hypothetical protein
MGCCVVLLGTFIDHHNNSTTSGHNDALRVDVDAKGAGVDAEDGDMDGSDGMDADDSSPSPSHGAITTPENSTHLFIGDLSRTATEVTWLATPRNWLLRHRHAHTYAILGIECK